MLGGKAIRDNPHPRIFLQTEVRIVNQSSTEPSPMYQLVIPTTATQSVSVRPPAAVGPTDIMRTDV